MNKDTLKQIGLTDSETEIYLDLVKNKESLASETALRVKISRTYVYDAIQSLIDKGLVSYVIKNNRRYFKALEPEKLLDYLNEKQKNLEKQKQDVSEIIKELKEKHPENKEKPLVEVLEGPEGIKTVLNDIVKQKKDICGWGGSDKSKEFLPEWFLERYINEKAKVGIKTNQLYVKGDNPLDGKGYKNKEISKEFSAPVTFGVYGDKIAIWFWSKQPIVIRIANKDIANSFRKHFEIMWKKV